MVKNAFLFLLFALCSFPVFAQQQVTTTEALYSKVATLNEEQKALLLENATAIQNGTSTAVKTKAWVDVSASLGTALAATAREMGVAVNDFARSPVGKLATVLIVWKVIGDDIVKLFISLGALLLMFGWYRMFLRSFGDYDDKGKLIKISTKTGYSDSKHGDGWMFLMMFLFPIGLLTTFIIPLASIG